MIFCSVEPFLLIVKPNIHMRLKKNEKDLLYMCLRIKFFTHIQNGRLSFRKRSKSLCPNASLFRYLAGHASLRCQTLLKQLLMEEQLFQVQYISSTILYIQIKGVSLENVFIKLENNFKVSIFATDVELDQLTNPNTP